MAADSSPLRRDEMSVIDLSRSSPCSSPSAGEGKRKFQPDDGESPVAAGKKPRTDRGRVEVKGKKVVFRQEPYQRTLSRRQLLNFEAWVLDAEEAGTKPTAIPDEFHSTIAMAGHELTSSSEAAFVKALKSELVKDASTNTLLSDLLAPLVPQLFTLKQYGFQPSDFGVGASRFPAGLQIRCWEVNDLGAHFPGDRMAELLARRSEREEARKDCEAILAGLTDDGKADLLKGEWSGAAPVRANNVPAAAPKDDAVADVSFKKEKTPGSSTTSPFKASAAGPSRTRSASPSKTPSKAKKLSPEEEEEARKRQEEREARKAEKEEKRKEREEKKAAKEREEQKKAEAKAKQAEVKAKQAKTFSSFFSKPKQPPVVKDEPVAAISSGTSDFQRHFRPPPQRANVEWAPLNFFSDRARASTPSSVSNWTAGDFIVDHLRSHRVDVGNPRDARPLGLKSTPRYGTVADMWTTYQEAEDPRAVLDELRDRSKFPWKTLAFDQQARPPYVGTFTKKSLTVGPRTPFAQDPVFDYSYDSGDDWQDEDEGGDDVDDPVANEDGDEDGEDEEDGEFDDWLDDSEETILVPTDADGDVPMVDMTRSSPQRVKPKKKLAPKRITKLTPTWRGPLWEETIAEPFEGLEEYRIQLLNDTPDTIDPFTYVASDPLPQFRAKFSDTMIGQQSRVPCLLSADEVNAARAAVPKPTTTTTAPAMMMPLGDASSSANKLLIKRVPKVAFPQSRMPEFLRLVDGNSRILTDLVSQLKIRFDKITTKAAIEAKIREVAVREGKAKDSKWKVRPEAWAAVGGAGRAPTNVTPAAPAAVDS